MLLLSQQEKLKEEYNNKINTVSFINVYGQVGAGKSYLISNVFKDYKLMKISNTQEIFPFFSLSIILRELIKSKIKNENQYEIENHLYNIIKNYLLEYNYNSENIDFEIDILVDLLKQRFYTDLSNDLSYITTLINRLLECYIKKHGKFILHFENSENIDYESMSIYKKISCPITIVFESKDKLKLSMQTSYISIGKLSENEVRKICKKNLVDIPIDKIKYCTDFNCFKLIQLIDFKKELPRSKFDEIVNKKLDDVLIDFINMKTLEDSNKSYMHEYVCNYLVNKSDAAKDYLLKSARTMEDRYEINEKNNSYKENIIYLLKIIRIYKKCKNFEKQVMYSLKLYQIYLDIHYLELGKKVIEEILNHSCFCSFDETKKFKINLKYLDLFIRKNQVKKAKRHIKAIENQYSDLIKDDKQLYGEYLFYKGRIYDIEGLFTESIECLQNAMNFLKNDSKIVIRIYRIMGVVFEHLRKIRASINMGEKALKMYNSLQMKDKFFLAMIYDVLGSGYHNLDDFEKTLFYYKKSLNLRTEILGYNNALIAYSYNNLGLVYQDNEQYDFAKEYFLKSLMLRKAYLDENDLVFVIGYSNLGCLSSDMMHFNDATRYFNRGLHIAKKILDKNHFIIAVYYNNLVELYKRQGKNKKALEFLVKYFNISKNYDQDPSDGEAYLFLAEILEHFEFTDCIEINQIVKELSISNDLKEIYLYSLEYIKKNASDIFYVRGLLAFCKYLNKKNDADFYKYKSIGLNISNKRNYADLQRKLNNL